MTAGLPGIAYGIARADGTLGWPGAPPLARISATDRDGRADGLATEVHRRGPDGPLPWADAETRDAAAEAAASLSGIGLPASVLARHIARTPYFAGGAVRVIHCFTADYTPGFHGARACWDCGHLNWGGRMGTGDSGPAVMLRHLEAGLPSLPFADADARDAWTACLLDGGGGALDAHGRARVLDAIGRAGYLADTGRTPPPGYH